MNAEPERVPRVALLLATGFGLGYLPVAPGTWGSLDSLGLFLLLSRWVPRLLPFGSSWEWAAGSAPFVVLHLAFVVLLAWAGVWSATKAATHFRRKDPGPVVIDEICGQQLALLGLATLNGKYLLAGFLLFRAFDIWKPFRHGRSSRGRAGGGSWPTIGSRAFMRRCSCGLRSVWDTDVRRGK